MKLVLVLTLNYYELAYKPKNSYRRSFYLVSLWLLSRRNNILLYLVVLQVKSFAVEWQAIHSRDVENEAVHLVGEVHMHVVGAERETGGLLLLPKD